MFGPQFSACDVVLPGEGRGDGTIGTGWSGVAALKVERDGVGLGEQHRFAWCRVGECAVAASSSDASRSGWAHAGCTVDRCRGEPACATVTSDAACAAEPCSGSARVGRKF